MSSNIFTNVKLYDGTGRTPFMADVAVKDEKIAAVAPCGTLNKTGHTVIDGKGLDLTPGFVDIHGHSDGKAVTVLSGDSEISQGVTVEVTGNCGFSDYLDEVKDNDLGEAIHKVRGNFRAYADLVERSHQALNIVHMCGHNTLRAYVMGYENRPPTGEEMRRMKELLADALDNGAGGFSGGPYYLPGKFADTEELKELASLLKGTGKPYATHIRSEGDELLESLAEAVEIAAAGDNNLQISHLKAAPESNWHKIDAAFELIEKAQQTGMDILADRYPYIHSNTSLRTVVPKPFDEVDTITLCTRLKESAQYRAELLAAL
ncbi:MAG: amidohydrolase family protein, partial [Lentisphaeria bacterium]|nr:amidohydrolase family protein [Lentisphaeria bacterium]